jgi:cytochrome d ubiquinol oxidase subunit I
LSRSRPLLMVLALGSPLGFVAIEAGWVVTEVGRQPWIIAHVMRTAEAVTTVPHLEISLVLFTALYLFLAAVVATVMTRHVMAAPD